MFLRWLNNKFQLANGDSEFEIKSDKIVRLQSHFIYTTGDFGSLTGGTNALATVVGNTNLAEQDKQGIGVLRTGTTTSGVARFGMPTGGSPSSVIQLGFQDWLWESMSRNLVLSTPTNRYAIIDGFCNLAAVTGGTDGVYFSYSDDTFNGNWTAVCVSNGVRTSVDTGIPASLLWEKRKITVDKDASSAKFYINNILVANIDTNIPKGTGRQLGLIFLIGNVTGTIGTRGVNIDYLEGVGSRHSYNQFTTANPLFTEDETDGYTINVII
jgi:hypothetical protein